MHWVGCRWVSMVLLASIYFPSQRLSRDYTWHILWCISCAAVAAEKSLRLKVSFWKYSSPTGLLPEVPMLQAFENEVGRGWTRLIIAVLTIISLCFSLLELSLPLHRMVSWNSYQDFHFQWIEILDFSNVKSPCFGTLLTINNRKLGWKRSCILNAMSCRHFPLTSCHLGLGAKHLARAFSKHQTFFSWNKG